MRNFLIMLGLGGVAAIIAYEAVDALDTARPTADMKPGCRGVSDPDLCRAIAGKWSGIFGCPVELMMVIGKIESGYRPDCANFSLAALSRGGAFGMFQQTLSTAKGHALALATSQDARVQATLAKWNGARSLLDPDLCGMFAAKQLGELSRAFPGNFAAITGAYHQGAGKIRSVLAQGGSLPDDLPPKGRVYVTRALAARGSIA